MLGQIGVTVKINTVPSPDFFEKYIRPGQFDFTVFSWIGTPYPDQLVTVDLREADRRTPKGELAIQQNYARVGSDEIDRLFAEATQELDRQRGDRAGQSHRRADLAGSAFADAVSASGDVGGEEPAGQPRRLRVCRNRVPGHRLGETVINVVVRSASALPGRWRPIRGS